MYVEVSLDRQAFTAQQTLFTISPPPAVTAISISSAPFEGGSRVTVLGRRFTDVLSLTCLFGPHAVLPGDYGHGVRAEGQYLLVSPPSLMFVGAEQLICSTPMVLVEENTPAVVTLDFSIDGSNFFHPLPFLLYPTPVITSIYPSSSEPGGGSFVTVIGRYFFDPPACSPGPRNHSATASCPIKCRFADLPPTPGTFLTTSTLRCATSPQTPGSEPFAVTSVSFNDHHYHSGRFDGPEAMGALRTPVRVAYFNLGVVVPSLGPSGAGIVVSLTGVNLLQRGACVLSLGSQRYSAPVVGSDADQRGGMEVEEVACFLPAFASWVNSVVTNSSGNASSSGGVPGEAGGVRGASQGGGDGVLGLESAGKLELQLYPHQSSNALDFLYTRPLVLTSVLPAVGPICGEFVGLHGAASLILYDLR